MDANSGTPDITIEDKTRDLLAELARTGCRKYRMDRCYGAFAGTCGFIFLGSLLFDIASHSRSGWIAALPWKVVGYVGVGAYILWRLPRLYLSEQVGRAAERLKAVVSEVSGDPRALGPLAQLTAATQLLSAADVTVEPLMMLLTNAKTSDSRHFSDQQMQALLGLLNTRATVGSSQRFATDLPLAILKALPTIGDSRAIEPVRRLTTGRRNRALHGPARECLAALEQIGDARIDERSLLIPSHARKNSSTLLRGAVAAGEARPDLLLRAGEGGGEK